MARFLTGLRVQLNDDEKTWTLLSDLVYETDIKRGCGQFVIVVPAGFVTDFASVPRLPLVYTVAGNIGHRAAVVHDWLYHNGIGTKSEADDIFCEALGVSNVDDFVKEAMHAAVSLFGRGSFQ